MRIHPCILNVVHYFLGLLVIVGGFIIALYTYDILEETSKTEKKETLNTQLFLSLDNERSSNNRGIFHKLQIVGY